MSRKDYVLRWPIDEEAVEQLRFRFLSDINATSSEIEEYHPYDIERVKEDDWFLFRYILHQNRDMDSALKILKESLKFRKDYEINTLMRKDLPAEYYSVRAVIAYNKDKKNHPLVVIRAKTHIKNEETRRLQKQYLLYWIEKCIKGSDWGIVSILFDCSNAGVANMDMDMIRFIMIVFKKYYPWGLSSFFVFNMPWYLSAFWRMIKTLVPEQYVEKILFVDNDTIKNYIDEDQLPPALGGTCPKLYEPKEGIEEDCDAYDNEIQNEQVAKCSVSS